MVINLLDQLSNFAQHIQKVIVTHNIADKGHRTFKEYTFELFEIHNQTSLGFQKADLNIFEMVLDKNTGEYLTAAEVMQLPISEYLMSSAYYRNGYALIDNSALEITELAIEMLERLECKFFEAIEDQKLMQNFHNLLRPSHYCFGAQSEVAPTFLRRHQRIFHS